MLISCRDLQSYLSHLSLFPAPESKKFYILLDNQPWLKDLVSGPAHFWQLMVTQVAYLLFVMYNNPLLFSILTNSLGNYMDIK